MDIPIWATHYVEMIDGSKFFTEMNGEDVIQFERADGECVLTPLSRLKASIVTISEYKSQLNHKHTKLGELS